MKRVKYSNNLFHIYAYFKIIKFLFPLIIFGFTDISRRFYVVAYMLVSHEQEVDYKHFLKKCNNFDACRLFRLRLRRKRQSTVENNKCRMCRLSFNDSRLIFSNFN